MYVYRSAIYCNYTLICMCLCIGRCMKGVGGNMIEDIIQVRERGGKGGGGKGG